MIEIRRVRGPLSDEQLGWIAELYGGADRKYASLDFLRHQFVGNPFGWSANVFALDGDTPAGHCGVIPFRARRGPEEFVAGKLEALAVAEPYRGRRAGGKGSVVLDVLTTLYPWAVENGCEVLFGLAPPRVGGIHVRAGCRLLPLGTQSLVLLADRAVVAERTTTRKQRAAALALGGAQHALTTTVAAGARLAGAGAAVAAGPHADDALAVAAAAGEGEWTISGADAWDWYRGSGVLRAVDVPGRLGSRAIVRLEDEPGKPLQLLAWRPRRAALLPALVLLASLARLARRSGSSSLRLQPWRGTPEEAVLLRACRLLGFARRPDADLLLYDEDPAVAALRVRMTPFFYVTF